MPKAAPSTVYRATLCKKFRHMTEPEFTAANTAALHATPASKPLPRLGFSKDAADLTKRSSRRAERAGVALPRERTVTCKEIRHLDWMTVLTPLGAF
jgi:hypothetical protein